MVSDENFNVNSGNDYFGCEVFEESQLNGRGPCSIISYPHCNWFLVVLTFLELNQACYRSKARTKKSVFRYQVAARNSKKLVRNVWNIARKLYRWYAFWLGKVAYELDLWFQRSAHRFSLSLLLPLLSPLCNWLLRAKTTSCFFELAVLKLLLTLWFLCITTEIKHSFYWSVACKKSFVIVCDEYRGFIAFFNCTRNKCFERFV